MRALPLLLLLAGCPSPGLVTGPSGIISQEGYTHGARQTCVHAAEAVDIAERVLPLALRELAAAGWVADPAKALRSDPLDHVSVCLIRQPEPCAGFGWTTTYPARGCANYGSAWGALCWHGKTAGWERAYLHELLNLARARWAGSYERDYGKLPTLAAIEQRVWTAYGGPRVVIEETCQ